MIADCAATDAMATVALYGCASNLPDWPTFAEEVYFEREIDEAWRCDWPPPVEVLVSAAAAPVPPVSLPLRRGYAVRHRSRQMRLYLS